MKSRFAIDRDAYLMTEGRELWSNPWPSGTRYAMNRIERAWLDGVRYAEAQKPAVRTKVAAPGWMRGKP